MFRATQDFNPKLDLPECRRRKLILRLRQLFLKIDDFPDLHQEPAVDLRQVENLVDGEPGAEAAGFTVFFACRLSSV